MLKRFLVVVILLAGIASCKDSGKNDGSVQIAPPDTTQTAIQLFPVTEYVLGQIDKVEKMEVTPLETLSNGDHVDSVWIKREEVRKEARPFLHPVIDSISLHQFYKGSSFLDRTVGFYTLTYTPKNNLPDSIDLTKIDIYIDTVTNKVQRIFLVKEHGDSTVQLTWKSGKWFSIRHIVGDKVSEKKVKWNFDQ